MTSNIVNQVAYLRTTRNFPDEMQQLTVELDKSYVDTANAINVRTIGIFPTNRPAITGEGWFISNNKQQTLRQIYRFTAAGSLAHGISNLLPGQVVHAFGSYTDGTNTYGAIFASNTVIAGQITFHVTSTNIVIAAGGGAPSISSGIIVLEWLVAA